MAHLTAQLALVMSLNEGGDFHPHRFPYSFRPLEESPCKEARVWWADNTTELGVHRDGVVCKFTEALLQMQKK